VCPTCELEKPLQEILLAKDPDTRKMSWKKCKSVVSLSGDHCKQKSFVVIQNDDGIFLGRIATIIQSQPTLSDLVQKTFIQIHKFNVSAHLHTMLDLPQLSADPDGHALVQPQVELGFIKTTRFTNTLDRILNLASIHSTTVLLKAAQPPELPQSCKNGLSQTGQRLWLSTTMETIIFS
jgi:hypothetical protein